MAPTWIPQRERSSIRKPALMSAALERKTSGRLTLARASCCGRFLSTARGASKGCFVMMPFGGWLDRYYHDIYAPAIRAAGLEPRRADELPDGGSIVTQIWKQIKQSSVLLADLSGQNANVFYELGIAHALGKPVVLTSSNLDDVPFDLRHLRVILYDTRAPDWATRLHDSVTAQLDLVSRERPRPE